jgi:phosphate starvation-inducible PhoH-like protein
MTSQELNSIVTRVGKNCRLVISGDCRQDDLQQHREKTGAWDFMQIAKAMGSFKFLEFGFDDIVRSEFVKEYIITRHMLEERNLVSSL